MIDNHADIILPVPLAPVYCPSRIQPPPLPSLPTPNTATHTHSLFILCLLKNTNSSWVNLLVLLLRLHCKYLKGSLCHARAGNSNLCLQYKAIKNMAQRVLGQHQSGKGHVSPRRPNALGTLPLHKPCVTSYSSFLLWKKINK